MRAVLGIVCHGWHESAAALVKDGVVVAAAEEERFTRRKLDSAFPINAIRYCLDHGGIRPAQLAAVGFGFDPRRRRGAKLGHLLRYAPGSIELVRTRGPLLGRLAGTEGEIRRLLPYDGPVRMLHHHRCHAASAFYAAPLRSAAVLTMDGVGDWETCWWGRGDGGGLTELGSVDWPRSLGHVYASLTEYLGFRAFHDEYKVMGLAAYGSPTALPAVQRVFRPTPNGFDVDLSYFRFHLGGSPRYSEKFVAEFGPPLRDPDADVSARHRDVAASFQRQLEEVVVHLARRVVALTGERDLCLAGGVALNSVANGRVAREAGIRSLFVPPCASDAGCALGAAYLASRMDGSTDREPVRSALLGPAYDDDRIRSAMTGIGLSTRPLEDPHATAARLIADGKVIGWFDGRMEFGQRALGARSILADPRDPAMKDAINAKIKFREPFRPFAPSVLEERATEYFECPVPIPFMTEVYAARESKRALIPAVVHVDGSARVHTVSRDAQPSYWKLIKGFEGITGIPLVLNTSFNTRGEPIVNTPEDAAATFRATALDALVAGRWLTLRDDRGGPADGGEHRPDGPPRAESG